MPRLLPLKIVLLLSAASALPAQTYTVLYNFGYDFGGRATDRTDSPGMIAQSRGGAMLSSAGNGVEFRMSTGGHLRVLHTFGGPSPGGLTLGTDGEYYGTTEKGGAYSMGKVFKMSQDGTVTTLHDFTGGSDGSYPLAPPIEGEDGAFYGTTSTTVYRITKYGVFTLLHDVPYQPIGPLVQGKDLYFYGTSAYGGPGHIGAIFRVNRSGDFKVLATFDGSNGNTPWAGLIQANDGNFYGVTVYANWPWWGVLFRMKPDGTLTVLHYFTNGSDGGQPYGGLVQASDGYLYGTTATGGAYDFGVLFRASLAGDVVPLYNFWTDGNTPESALLQHTNGLLYGKTLYSDTVGGDGVFYSLDAGLPPFVTYLPVYGRAGAVVKILGQGFDGATQVFFNGSPAASTTIVYPTYLKAVVPDGATTGPITVTTANGTLTSNKVLVVHPK